MKRIAAIAVLLLGATWAPPAAADVQARARLVYQTLTGTERCPGEADLRAAVGVRLGYDPFVAEASTEVAVRLEARGRGIVGVLEVRGTRPGQREIASPEGDCREVVDALATAIAIGVDPASLSRAPNAPPPPPPEPAPTPAPVVARPPPAPEASVPTAAVVPPPSERVHPSFGALGVLALGELPKPAPGFDVWFGARYRFASAALEGSFAMASGDVGRAAASATLLTVGLAPCAHYKLLFGCIVARIGSLRAEGQSLDLPERASALYGSVAARIGVQPTIAGPFFVRAYAELGAPLTRIGFELDGREEWATPTIAARFAVGAGLQF